jgi:hypothetical protein
MAIVLSPLPGQAVFQEKRIRSSTVLAAPSQILRDVLLQHSPEGVTNLCTSNGSARDVARELVAHMRHLMKAQMWVHEYF